MTSLDLFATRRTSLGLTRWRGLNVSLILSWLIIGLAFAFAVAPGLFTPHSGTVGIAGNQLRAPDALHWLGTDEIGRDVLARIIYGSINSLSGAIVAVLVGELSLPLAVVADPDTVVVALVVLSDFAAELGGDLVNAVHEIGDDVTDDVA